MADFTMPSLGADMETGKVVEWLVKSGDRVKPGDVVAVVETHKGAIDVECFLDGVIDELVAPGEELPVGAVLARVRTVGEAPPTPMSAPAPVPAPMSKPAPPAAPKLAPPPPTAPAPSPPQAPRCAPGSARRHAGARAISVSTPMRCTAPASTAR